MRNKDNFNDKHVIVTGGSSGIGYAIAKAFLQLGAHVHIFARNKEKLIEATNQLQQVNHNCIVKYYVVDVTEAIAVKSAIESIGETFGIDVVINNAGASICRLLEDTEPVSAQSIMDTNYQGALYMIHYAWPFLMKSKGRIGFVNSVAGYLGIIGYSSYSATKFALRGVAECLRLEAKDQGISITTIYPPDTDTPMLHGENKIEDCLALSAMGNLWRPEQVAEKFVKGIINRKFEVYCGFENRLYLILKELLPSLYYAISDWIVYRDRKKREKVSA